MPTAYNLANDIDLPIPTALWVLAAHLYALLVPLVLVTAVTHHWAELVRLTAYPIFFFVATGLMMAGSAFEIAQNTIDRWYLTPEVGSANGTGFCDMLFYACIVASQGFVVLACMGDIAWFSVPAVALMLIAPLLYLRQTAHFVPLSVLGVLAAVTAFLRLGEPAIFLQLLLAPLTILLFVALLRTGNQVLHGCTTVAASSGVLFLAWGIHSGATGETSGWNVTLGAAVVTGLLVLAVRPWLYQLPPTPRRES
jgi:hypothetical protein